MSAKDCGHHKEKRRRFLRLVFATFLFILFIILLTIFIIWLVLRPTKPRFTLQDATVYQFNITGGPNLISSSLQVTVASRNPNDRISVYYDRLDIFAVYRNQQITLPTSILPTYQGHKDTIIWSPYLVGAAVPVAPFIGEALLQDQAAGVVMLNVKMDGRVRWKVGAWVSGSITCTSIVLLFDFWCQQVPLGLNVGPAVKLQLDRACNVDV
ncbi:hypothetical protein Syun_002465 [Stephania yunnanensis]|uniref:Late embryogenesis abundant protein LEA-2 subgroup domain-containing protein n=1 Tax=Stephania yunnanensis TaxID=152371 RepID=A0AAP0LIP0_9MAGN